MHVFYLNLKFRTDLKMKKNLSKILNVVLRIINKSKIK